ncbi:MAG: hypothetical protein ACYC4L_01065 [Chloroflexota bacterium]
MRVPKFNAPDEPAHFNYVRHLATTGTLPVLQPGDYDQAALERLTTARFPDSLSIDGVRYAAHHPPLYYLVGASLYLGVAERPLNDQVLALRGLSVLFSVLTIVAVYGLALAALPGRRAVALGAAVFAGGVPMFQFLGGAVENDSLAVLLATTVLLVLVQGLRAGFSRRRSLLLGLLLGLVLLTKTTVYGVLPVALLALWARAHLDGSRETTPWVASGSMALVKRVAPLAAWFRQGVLVYVLALVLSAWWFARNALTYGWLDPFGLRRHDAVVLGQPRSVLGWPWLEHLVTTTFQSFWAQFGWMGILVDRRLYQVMVLLTAVAIAGLLVWGIRLARRDFVQDRPGAWALGLLGLFVLIIAGEFLFYNLTFVQAQGRYLFPAIGPLAHFFALGLVTLLPRRWQLVVPVGLYLGLFAFSYLCLYRFVIPFFAAG